MKKIYLLLLLLTGCATAPTAHAAKPYCGPGLDPDRICKAAIRELRPTQMSVGMVEVRANQKKLEKLSADELDALLRTKPEPIVVGPDGQLFIIDHHHLARTLYEMGVEQTYGQIVADYSDKSKANFWRKMEKQKWAYPYDESGRGPYPYEKLPSHIGKLTDDPYRSLAGIVRRRGGFGKTSAPFAEFVWADFFRKHIRIREDEAGFAQAVQEALELSRSKEAKGLPGYLG